MSPDTHPSTTDLIDQIAAARPFSYHYATKIDPDGTAPVYIDLRVILKVLREHKCGEPIEIHRGVIKRSSL